MGMMISRNRKVIEQAEASSAEKTKAQLVAEAEAKGIEVPSKATKEDIQKLIEEN